MNRKQIMYLYATGVFKRLPAGMSKSNKKDPRGVGTIKPTKSGTSTEKTTLDKVDKTTKFWLGELAGGRPGTKSGDAKIAKKFDEMKQEYQKLPAEQRRKQKDGLSGYIQAQGFKESNAKYAEKNKNKKKKSGYGPSSSSLRGALGR